MDLNGLSQTVSTIGNYSQYVSGYMVMGPHNMVTNHYYSGTERIACKLVGSVDSSVDNSLELSGTEKAGLPGRQAEDLELVRTEFGFDTLIIDDVDPDEDDCEGNNDCPNVLYFFHPDHIGSSTFLTDEAGNPYQFILYLPFGEGMAEQKAGGYSTKYRFTSKEVDEETGLYYFGARYYDPRISLWYGVDPMADEFPDYNPFNYTFNNPIVLKDPDGRNPIIGFCIGFALDVATQMVFEGKGVSEVSYKKSLVAGGAGMLSSGLSSVAKFGKIAQIATNATIDATESIAKQTIDGNVNLDQTISDVFLAGVGSQVNGLKKIDTKAQEKAVDRAERIIKNNSGNSGNQLKSAKKDLNNRKSTNNLIENSNSAFQEQAGNTMQAGSDKLRKINNTPQVDTNRPVQTTRDNTMIVIPILDLKSPPN